MAVTMKDIAKLAGVSSATISKVINGQGDHISFKKREEINKLIHETGYVPNSIARGLKNKQTKMLGFILPDISNPFFPEITRGIEDEAKKYGFGVVVCNTDNDLEKEEKAFSFLTSKMVDGIIFTHSMHTGEMNFLDTDNVPIVIVDRINNVNKSKYGQVYVDAKEGIAASTRHLIENGCKKIAFISGESREISERYLGFLSELRKNDLSEYRQLQYFENYDMQTGECGILKIMQSSIKPDGIVCGNDLVAIGAISKLKEMEIHIPDDVRVIGFDDIYLSHYISPSLSTISQPAYEMGQKASRMLIEHILNGQKLFEEKLNYKLVVRESG